MYIFFIVLIVVLFAIILIKFFNEKEKEKNFIENHKQIQPGMSKMTVISILGDSYTQSYLKNGVEKLEWRYRRNGTSGRVAKGMYVHQSSYTRRISVKFKEGKAIEINSLNMD